MIFNKCEKYNFSRNNFFLLLSVFEEKKNLKICISGEKPQSSHILLLSSNHTDFYFPVCMNFEILRNFPLNP